METLHPNEIWELANSVQLCGNAFYRQCAASGSFRVEPCELAAPCWCHTGTKCLALVIPPFCKPPEGLIAGLKACSGEFYARCPGFERIERYCEFEPAIEAAKFKEQVQLERIAKLEARVQELELRKQG